MNTKNNNRLFGLHIYTDDKGRYIFYNIFNKTPYLLTSSDDIKKFTIYQTRLALSIVVGFFVLNFLEMPILGVSLGVVVYVVMTIFLYTKFIPNLAIAKNFDIKAQDSFLMRYLAPMSNTRIVIAVCLLMAISLLIIFNVRISDFDKLTVILNYIVSVVATIAAIVLAIAYIIKVRTKKGGNKR